MKPEQLKLYNKYKNIIYPDIEYIYIGVDKDGFYWFLYKVENVESLVSTLKHFALNPDKIIKDLNLKTFINKYGNKYIKGYDWEFYAQKQIETYFKPHLKDKINNIINR